MQEQDVCAYKRILVHKDQQPSKYMRQTKPRDRSYKPKSVRLKSREEGVQPESDLRLSENIHTDDAVCSSEPESEEGCLSMEEPFDDVASDEREREQGSSKKQ